VAARCGANNGCRMVGAALQRYGAYVVDFSGVATFAGEDRSGQAQKWGGLMTTTDSHAFLATDFELLSLPQSMTIAP